MNRKDHHQVMELLDGGMSAAEFEQFQQRLRKNPELAAMYRDYALLHHCLCEEFEHQPVARRVVKFRKPGVAGRVAGGLAALAAMAFFGILIFRQPPATAVPAPLVSGAELRFSDDAVWLLAGQNGSGVRPRALRIGTGEEMSLLQGSARIELSTGAVAVINGPAALVYENDERLFLSHGAGWFRHDNPDAGLTVATNTMEAVDLSTEFAVVAESGKPAELHVIDGKVRMIPVGKSDGPVLEAGRAGRAVGPDRIELFEARPEQFLNELPVFHVLLDNGFSAGDWRVDTGEPVFTGNGMRGSGFTAFRKPDALFPTDDQPVMLATMTVEAPADGGFHTPGWAGLSFMRDGEEVLFFGDSHGDDETWSIDIKQGLPVVLPDVPLAGSATVTLRYDMRDGVVTLHRGGIPIVPEFCRGQIAPGVVFDEIRAGAADGATLDVRTVRVLTGGRPQN
jgi:ferric-dicitrate binding protein FerR (iron transport regulator)